MKCLGNVSMLSVFRKDDDDKCAHGIMILNGMDVSYKM